MKRKALSVILIIILSCTAMFGCTEHTPVGSDIVASIGNETINYALYNAAFESYREYMTQIGGGISDEDDLITFQDMIMDYLLVDMLTLYHADKEGFVLPEEDKQAAIKQAESELKDIKEEYMELSRTDYEKDSSKTVEQYFEEYISALSDYYLGEKLNFEQYSEAYTNELIRSHTIEAYKAYVCESFVAPESDINDWYEEQYNLQTENYKEYPEQYKFDQEYFEQCFGMNDDAIPCVYVPKGYSRIMDIVVKPSGKLSEEYKALQTKIKDVYSECSELAFDDALNGDNANEERIAELVKEYKKLQSESDAMYDDYIHDAKEKIDEAYAELESGADFSEVMLKYSENTAVVGDDSNAGCEAFQTKGQIISLEYSCASDWSDTVKEIFGMLRVGEYSNIFADDDGSLHIIKYVSDITAGTVELEDVYDSVKTIVKSSSDEKAWSELMDAWLDDSSIKRNSNLIRSIGKDLIEDKDGKNDE